MFNLKNQIARLKGKFARRAVILMYHSIGEPGIDPWELAVSPSNFEAQLEVLKKRFKVSGIPDILSDLKNSRLKSDCVGLSFDDGYLDNFITAKPLLEQYNLPATFFIPSMPLNGQKFFWWDKLAALILETSVLPAEFSIKIRADFFNYSISGERELTDSLRILHRDWVMPCMPPTKRSNVFYTLWKLMLPLSPDEIEKAFQKLQKVLGVQSIPMRPESNLMTVEQLKIMGAHRLFNIGVHTVNHIALSHHSAEIQEEEILHNKRKLEQVLNTEINALAYPYGDYNSITMKVAKKLGLAAGFSVENKPVNRFCNPFNLGRFQVKNWKAEEFEKRLNQWMHSN